jgi:isocitrate/isopropylmalate dehydrogenase
MSERHRVAVVEGDDAAPEVVRPAVRVAEATRAPVDWVTVDAEDPASAKATIDAAEATLLGAASRRSLPLLLHLRWGLETFANVRPVRYLPGARSPLARPDGIDFVIVRENLEDLYAGVEGDLTELTPLGRRDRRGRPIDAGAGAYAVKVITPDRTADVARVAFSLARRRAAAREREASVTVGVKHNVMPRTDGLFLEVSRQVATEFPDVGLRVLHADDLGRLIVAAPHQLDVLLLPNLYGDLLSDVAAGVVGGLGLAPSGCYGHRYAYFEAVHGTAPDLVGRNIINPTAQFLSTAMLLEHLGATEAAGRVVGAVEAAYADGSVLTPDQGGSATTRQFTDAVIGRVLAS